MPTATFRRRHAAKLVSTLGPEAVVAKPWFLPFSLYHFVGGSAHPRPPYPPHLTTKENPGVFREWARLELWRQRKRAGVSKPALGLWKGGRLPPWAVTVSKAMDAAGKPPGPAPKPPTPVPAPFPNQLLVARAQCVMFTAWRPLSGVHGRLAITADVNVGGDPGQHVEWAKQAVAQTHDRGFEVAAWANQSQVGIDHLRSFGGQIGADYLIWQAETIGEMIDVGIHEGGSILPGSPLSADLDGAGLVLIGNANAWTDAQRAKVTQLVNVGKLAFIQETYTNEGDPWPDAFGTQGVPVASICPGVGWGRTPIQLPDYKPHTPVGEWPTICPYVPEDFSLQSWQALPW